MDKKYETIRINKWEDIHKYNQKGFFVSAMCIDSEGKEVYIMTKEITELMY